MKPIILASTSLQRKELLEKLGLPFTVVASDYEEDMNQISEPMELAKQLSQGKAKAIADKYSNHLIIAADTFMLLGSKLLGKPGTSQKALDYLREISGKCISAISGITVLDTKNNKILSEAVETKVYIKELSDEEIQTYVETKEPLDKAGAFAIQGLGAVVVERIDGDFYNVIGFPLYCLTQMLKEFGVHVL